MPERRAGSDRRTRLAIPEPLTRRAERREEERRDCPRRPLTLDVREPGGQSRSCMGDLSVSGASFITTAPPAKELVQLMFSLPTFVGPITAAGWVVARTGLPEGTMVSVAFADIDVEAQLAIAQWFDEGTSEAPSGAATSPL